MDNFELLENCLNNLSVVHLSSNGTEGELNNNPLLYVSLKNILIINNGCDILELNRNEDVFINPGN